MSLIEGIGDEVTVGFCVLLLLCLVLLAWFSTHTRDIPFVSIIVVELSQRRHLRNRNRGSGDIEPSSSRESASTEASGTGRETSSTQASEGDVGLDTNSAPVSSETSTKHNLSGEENMENLESVSDRTAKSDPSHGTGESDSIPGENLISDVTQESGAGQAQDSVEETISTKDASAEVTSEDANSPDEVRKRRVAYFESTRRKEYEEREQDITDSDTPDAGAEHSKEVSASGAEVNSSSKETASSAASSNACPSDSSEVGGERSGPREGSAEMENPGPESHQIRVRLKYLNDTQRLVYASPEETIGNFRRTHFSAELGENKIVRFIFNGQDLRNDLWTLNAYNVSDNSVIHCLITQSPQQQETSSANAALGDDDLEIGVFIYPVFGLILGVLWYFRFSYKQYFNAVSTVSLAGVSFIYCLALVSSLRGRQRPHQHLD